MDIRLMTYAVFLFDPEGDQFLCIVMADGFKDAADKYAKYKYHNAQIQIDDFGCGDDSASEFLIHASLDVPQDMRVFVGPRVQNQERIRVKTPTVIE